MVCLAKCGLLGHYFSSCSEVVQRSPYSCHPWLEGLSLQRTPSLRFILPGIQGDSLAKVRGSDLSLCLLLEYMRQSDTKSW